MREKLVNIKKKHEWSTKGGYIAPIFVLSTPGSELLKYMREVAKREAKDVINFKIIEIGEMTLQSELQRSNPTSTPGCTEADCLACKQGRYHRANVK